MAAVPFYVQGPDGDPVGRIEPGALSASVSWYGNRVDLPIERIEPSGEGARVTLLVDVTPGVMDFHRREILNLATELLNTLNLEDEIRFVTFGQAMGCQFKPGPKGVQQICPQGPDDVFDTGFVSLEELYPAIGRYCRMHSWPSMGACRPVESPRDAEYAVGLFLGNLIGRGWSDADVVQPFATAVDGIDGMTRNALVVVSDFRYLHEDPKLAFPQLFWLSTDRPLSLFFVGTDPKVPLQRIGVGDVHYLKPGLGVEIGRTVAGRIPPIHVALLDATPICGNVRECTRIELRYEGGGEGEHEVFATRCASIESATNFAKRLKRIRQPEERVEYVRSALTYRNSRIAPHVAEGLRKALRKERVEEVKVAMEEVLHELNGL